MIDAETRQELDVLMRRVRTLELKDDQTVSKQYVDKAILDLRDLIRKQFDELKRRAG